MTSNWRKLRSKLARGLEAITCDRDICRTHRMKGHCLLARYIYPRCQEARRLVGREEVVDDDTKKGIISRKVTRSENEELKLL